MGNNQNKKIIIHIGLPKSGSSFLQEYLLPFLEERGHITFFNFQRIDQIIRKLVYQDDFSFNPEELRKEILGELAEGINIISVEWLSGIVDFKMFNTVRTAERIQSVLPEAQIILILRNQVDFIYSAYKQHIHQGGRMTFKQYINYYGDSIIYNYDHYNYSFNDYRFNFHGLNLVKLIDLYSKTTLHILLFEEFLIDKNTFIDRFLKIIEVSLDINLLKNPIINRGFGSTQILIARVLNPLFKSVYNQYGFTIFPHWVPILGKISTYHLRKALQSKWSFILFGNKSIKLRKYTQALKQYYIPQNVELIEKLPPEYRSIVTKYYL